MKMDPYQILEIPIDSSLQEIKKSYKKLILKYHPDKNIDPSAHNKFLLIQKAYTILKDDNMREYRSIVDIDDYDEFINIMRTFMGDDISFLKNILVFKEVNNKYVIIIPHDIITKNIHVNTNFGFGIANHKYIFITI